MSPEQVIAQDKVETTAPGTDFAQLIGDLDAGVLLEKLSSEISKMALACVTHGRTGKMELTLEMKQIGHNNQVNITHKMKSTVPSLRGRKIEEDITQTPLHVGKRGKMTFYPDTQTGFKFQE